jgi:hypothetical protein
VDLILISQGEATSPRSPRSDSAINFRDYRSPISELVDQM